MTAKVQVGEGLKSSKVMERLAATKQKVEASPKEAAEKPTPSADVETKAEADPAFKIAPSEDRVSKLTPATEAKKAEEGSASPRVPTEEKSPKPLTAILAKNPMLLVAPFGLLMAFGSLFSLLGKSGLESGPTEVVTRQHATQFPDLNLKGIERAAVTDDEVRSLIQRANRRPADAVAATTAPVMVAPTKAEPAIASVAPTGERLFTAAEMEAAIAAARKQATRSRRPSMRRSRKPERKRLPLALLGTARGVQLKSHTAKSSTAKKRSAFAVATRIPAQLDVGLSSARLSTVIARTTAPVTMISGKVVPAGATLTGRAGSGHDRMYVDFRKLTWGQEEATIQAVAMAGTELGIPAQRIESSLEDRTSDRVANSALGALKGVASLGGPLGNLVSGAADGVLDEAQREHVVDRSFILRVPAGTAFNIVVTD